jgi:clan AA aspartic protease
VSRRGQKEIIEMGVFWVEIKVRNWQNRFLPEDERGEDIVCKALVDSGAVQLSLPVDLVERLKLMELGQVRVYTADGGEHEYRVMGIAEVELRGRSTHVRVIELPRGARPLLGAIPLEEMDWHISPVEKKLVPNPRSPEKPLLPLC